MTRRKTASWFCLGVIGLLLVATTVTANHPVIVEGNCLNPPGGNPTLVPPGTCGDYDGDGRIGTAEDTDGDRVFGTIGAALGGGTGANQNGMVTIVTSGVFPEVVSITGANGNVTLQAAPGVEANIDAILQGDPGNAARQGAPGIIVNAPANRYVVLRNLMVRNWTSGVQIVGPSRVAIEHLRLENNVNFGVEVRDSARVTIARSQVHATGFRVGGGLDFPAVSLPQPGAGIQFSGDSDGTVVFTTVSGSFAAGIADQTRGQICVSHVNVFDNHPNFHRVRRGQGECNVH
jgi:hypothetical protein